MELIEFDQFMENPTPEKARLFGIAITKIEGDINEKKELYSQAFDIVEPYSKADSIINMWAIASMMEDPNIEFTTLIQTARDCFKDPEITPQEIEEWAWMVFKIKRASEDILDFLAGDVRNLHGISRDLREMLGHPCPDNPFADGSK
jgi:hypothetical protein